MARKRVVESKAEIHSWNEADATLQRIAVLKSQMEERIAEYNAEEQQRRLVITKMNAPVETEILYLESGLKSFCENNRHDFGKLKSKELQHGTVNFRLSPPKVATKKGFTFGSVLELVKRSVWKSEFVRIKEELDKETILLASQREKATITSEELSALGLEIKQDETFGYDLKLAAN